MLGGFLGVGGLIGGIVTLILGVIILVWPRFVTTIIRHFPFQLAMGHSAPHCSYRQ